MMSRSSLSTSSATSVASCPTPSQQTVTLHLVWPRQAVQLASCNGDCGVSETYPGRPRLPCIICIMPLYWPLCYMAARLGPCIDAQSRDWTSSIFAVCIKLLVSSGRIESPIQRCCIFVVLQVLKRSCSTVNFVGSVTLCTCQSTVYQNKFSMDNWHRASSHSVDPPVVTKILWGSTWSNVTLTQGPWPAQQATAHPGELCVTKQSLSLKMHVLQHWCTSELSTSSMPSLPVVSVFGHATAAPESVVPESGFLPIRRRTSDNRSVVLDVAVHVYQEMITLIGSNLARSRATTLICITPLQL